MTAGRHDGGPPLALPTRPYVCPLPSHQARTMRACSDNMGCASPRTRAVHAGMDVLERRCRSVVVVPTPLALGVALYTTADVAAQVRRCAQLQTRAHGALASHLSLHCASRGKCAARAACWRACTASTCVATHGPALDPASMMTLRAAARSRSPRASSCLTSARLRVTLATLATCTNRPDLQLHPATGTLARLLLSVIGVACRPPP